MAGLREFTRRIKREVESGELPGRFAHAVVADDEPKGGRFSTEHARSPLPGR